MKNIRLLLSCFFAFSLAFASGSGIAQSIGLTPLIGGSASLVLLGISAKYMSARTDLYVSGIQKEIWENLIVENLYKNNQFLGYSFNADEYVLQGKVVHIPQAAAPSATVKNRAFNAGGATITRRVDTDITYSLDEYTTDPRVIQDADTVELSYDKMNSVTTEDQASLRDVTADNMLINWAPSNATSILRTTGTLATTYAYLPSATGSRRKLQLSDIQAAMKLMNKYNIPQEERYCLLSAEMYDQLISELTATQYRDFSAGLQTDKGIVGKLMTFNIMMRSSVLIYDNSATPVVKAYGAAAAATDNDAALFWQKNSVERALGEVKMFSQPNSPTQYGDIYSFLVRMGGRIRRNDQYGVIALVQAAV